MDTPNASAIEPEASPFNDPALDYTKPHFRTIFLSDLHLGFKGARAEELAKLLKRVRCEKLYLVGDIIDMWRLKARWHWPTAHNDVIRRILKMAKKGVDVVYIPGNHDEAVRPLIGHLELAGIRMEMLDRHKTADDRDLLITHGDQFDLIIKHHRLLSVLGSMAYEWLVRVNMHYNRIRKMLGFNYWSLSSFAKAKVKSACSFISKFEETLVQEAQRRGVDGVVCGHIHKAESSTIDQTAYYNCGDWVESCTLLVEHHDGSMEVLDGIQLLERIDNARRDAKVAELMAEQEVVEIPTLDSPQPAAPTNPEIKPHPAGDSTLLLDLDQLDIDFDDDEEDDDVLTPDLCMAQAILAGGGRVASHLD